VEKVEITPEEVRQFFNDIPRIDLPIFGTELEIAQIVVEPKVSEEENERIIDQLKLFREDILEGGMSFASKALLYSQDPGSRRLGGICSLSCLEPTLVVAFRVVAFRLRAGDLSRPFPADFGWPIVLVAPLCGPAIAVRLVLLLPHVSLAGLGCARARLALLCARVLNAAVAFSDAALLFSAGPASRLSGGVVVPPCASAARFGLPAVGPLLSSPVRAFDARAVGVPFFASSDPTVPPY
jgi:Parvulin-like peptidyl-prolyl isomerase